MNQRPKPWGFWSTAGLSFCVWIAFVVVQTAVVIATLLVSGIQNRGSDIDTLAENLSLNGFVLAIATTVSAPICIGVICFFIRLRKGWAIADYLQLGEFSTRLVKPLFIWNLITVAFVYTIDYLKTLLPRSEISTFTADIYESAGFLPLLYIAIVIAAPLFEEVYFRGFMLRGFVHSAIGPVGAILLTSAIWAVIHSQYDVYDMTGIFLFGVLLAIAQLWTRSLYVPISMHALNNLLAMLTVAVNPPS
ncbi:MAG: CPBP family intramembrane glutamic endopeptidase [Leptolyngbyaceae bacterium]|nr:CPBP family intramembrane glutamic endopeptidase [Leptolyngbyaceae bacterium]